MSEIADLLQELFNIQCIILRPEKFYLDESKLYNHSLYIVYNKPKLLVTEKCCFIIKMDEYFHVGTHLTNMFYI